MDGMGFGTLFVVVSRSFTLQLDGNFRSRFFHFRHSSKSDVQAASRTTKGNLSCVTDETDETNRC